MGHSQLDLYPKELVDLMAGIEDSSVKTILKASEQDIKESVRVFEGIRSFY
jgi:hypothetical protein